VPPAASTNGALRRVERFFEAPVTIAAVLVVPVIVVELEGRVERLELERPR
jgi:hypothetical protein